MSTGRSKCKGNKWMIYNKHSIFKNDIWLFPGGTLCFYLSSFCCTAQSLTNGFLLLRAIQVYRIEDFLLWICSFGERKNLLSCGITGSFINSPEIPTGTFPL